jgi:hypothetical protein
LQFNPNLIFGFQFIFFARQQKEKRKERGGDNDELKKNGEG